MLYRTSHVTDVVDTYARFSFAFMYDTEHVIAVIKNCHKWLLLHSAKPLDEYKPQETDEGPDPDAATAESLGAIPLLSVFPLLVTTVSGNHVADVATAADATGVLKRY